MKNQATCFVFAGNHYDEKHAAELNDAIKTDITSLGINEFLWIKYRYYGYCIR